MTLNLKCRAITLVLIMITWDVAKPLKICVDNLVVFGVHSTCFMANPIYNVFLIQHELVSSNSLLTFLLLLSIILYFIYSLKMTQDSIEIFVLLFLSTSYSKIR